MKHYCQAWVDDDIIENRKAEMYIVGTYIWKPSGDEVDLWTKDIFPVGALETKWCKIRWNTGRKDKNKVEIYEGDLIQNFNGRICRVEWHQQQARWDCTPVANTENTTAGGFNSSAWEYCVEVIGNIYENPELVKDNV